jgi:hypothetical protein
MGHRHPESIKGAVTIGDPGQGVREQTPGGHIENRVGSSVLTGLEAKKHDISKALMVTVQGIRHAGLLESLEECLPKSHIQFEIFIDCTLWNELQALSRLYQRKEGMPGLPWK